MKIPKILDAEWIRKNRATPVILFGAFMVVMFSSAASISSNTQLPVALIGILSLLVLKFFNKDETIRVLFLTIALFLSIDYFYWRTFTTLAYYDPISFACSLLLYFAEVYGLIVYFLSVFVNIDPLDRKPIPLPEDTEVLPTVDVMIPTYNEDIAILEVTVISSLQMRYPKDKVTIWVLDDGGTDERCMSSDPEKSRAARRRRKDLQTLCAQWGVRYQTRERNLHAKAGNINNGLQHSHSELVLILDADHAPTEDFLQNTVGWFLKDPKLFLVQTPHFFTNPDPIEKNLQTFQEMPGESEMFYKVIQKGLDFWNSAFFCGSAAVMRRSCLKEIGGISGDSITEDAETALTLHAKGYNSAYIAKPMISGLSPETLGGFIGQRIRWAQGMVQIFLLKNPLLIPGLTFPQRLCYFSSCFFWFFAYARVVFILAPLCFLLFGLKIYNANLIDFTLFAIPHLFAVFWVSDFLFGKVRWSFVSELYELVQSIYTLPAIIKVFMNPRAPTFIVTAKGETLDQDFISPLARPFYIFLILNLTALGFGVYRIFAYPLERFPTVVTMCWAVFNVVILLACMGVLLERRQRRSSARMPITTSGNIEIEGRKYAVQLSDVSIGGVSILVDAAYESIFHVGHEIPLFVQSPQSLIGHPFYMTIRNIRVKGSWMHVGAQFNHYHMDELKRKILLVNGSSDRWVDFQKSRERRLGVVRSGLFLVQCGIRYSIEHFAYVMLTSRRHKNMKTFHVAPQNP